MKKVGKKNVTIDDLAIMVAKGFERMENRFDKNDERFGRGEKDMEEFKSETKNNFEKVRNDILNIGDRFVPWHQFDQHSLRLEKLEHKMHKMK